MKRFIALFMVLALMFCSTTTYATTKTGSEAKAEYMRVEKRAFLELVKSIKDSELGKFINFYSNFNDTYESTASVEVNIPDMKTRKYVVSEKGIYSDFYEEGTIDAYVENEKVATCNIIQNDTVISLMIPQLFDKYITLDFADMASLMKKIDPDIDTDKLPTKTISSLDIKNIIELSKEEENLLSKSGKKYAKLLDEALLKNEYFTKGSKQNVFANNKSYNCSTVKFSISNKQLIAGIESVWNELKKDNKLVELFWGKLEAIYNLYHDANYPGYEEEFPTKEQAMGVIDTLIRELKSEDIEESVVEIVLYHQNNKLLKREIGTKDATKEERIHIYTVNDNKTSYFAICVGDEKLEDFVTKSSKETIHNFVHTSIEYEYDYIDEDFVSTPLADVSKLEIRVKEISKNTYEIEVVPEDLETKIVLEYKVNKNTSKIFDCDFNIKVTDSGETVAINTNMVTQKDVKISKKNIKSSEIDITKMSREELSKLVEENKDEIIKKLDEKFLSAFYYEEIVGANKAMMEEAKVRINKMTATQIAKAVRVWYTDTTSDQSLSYRINSDNFLSTNWIKYSNLEGIEEYIYTDYVLEDGYDYYVGLTNEGKIAVGLSKLGTDLPSLSSDITISTENTGSRVIYIEP